MTQLPSTKQSAMAADALRDLVPRRAQRMLSFTSLPELMWFLLLSSTITRLISLAIQIVCPSSRQHLASRGLASLMVHSTKLVVFYPMDQRTSSGARLGTLSLILQPFQQRLRRLVSIGPRLKRQVYRISSSRCRPILVLNIKAYSSSQALVVF